MGIGIHHQFGVLVWEILVKRINIDRRILYSICTYLHTQTGRPIAWKWNGHSLHLRGTRM